MGALGNDLALAGQSGAFFTNRTPLRAALVAALHLNLFIQHCVRRVSMANLRRPSNVLAASGES